MAPKELETTTIELADGPYELRASATKVLFDGFARVYTEGRDDEATDDDEETGRLPALTEGDRTTVRDVTPTQHFTEPPPRFTEATLIKALEEHGIGRPSTYAATISTITDRGYVRVEDRRLRPEPVADIVTDLLVDHFGEYVDVAVHGPDGRGARRDRQRGAGVGPVPARLLRAVYEARRREGHEIEPLGPRRPTRSAPKATRWSSGWVATARSWPARSTRSTRRRGRSQATSRRPRRGPARPAPSAGRDAGQQDRAVRTVRRLLALSRLQVHQEGRPAAARSAPVRGHLPDVQGRPSRPAPRAAHGERLLGLLPLPALRLHHEPRATRWPARCRRGPDRAEGRGGDLPHLRRDQRPAGGDIVPGERLPWRPGRSPRPSPGRPEPRWPASRWRDEGRRSSTRRRAGPAAATTKRTARSSRPPARDRGGGPPDDRSRPRAFPPLTRRARRLAAHAARLRHRCRRLRGWLDEHGRTGEAPRERPAGLPRESSATAAPDRRSRTAWPRSARSTGSPPGATSRRATRWAPSPRLGCRAGCRASSRSTRSTRCWRSSTTDLDDRARAMIPSMPRSGWRCPA